MTVKPKAVETAVAETEAVATKTFEKTVESLKQSAATATASIEQAQAQLKEGYDRAMKTAEQLAQFHQANLEAVMKSSQILATGLTDMTKYFAGNAQASLEETMSNFRALTSAKSLKEAFDLQSGYARTSLEKVMSEGGKLTETSLKLLEQATAPISARVTAAVETFTTR
ncbi:MAG TPA: phasin family protein [Acetobacteraceae bacterium]|nr:phasin family protein [Acetobacteraceae bacterium]